MSKLVNIPFGGKSPFSAEIWYINKINVLDVKWGTQTPMQLQDPKYNIFIPVRAFGQFGIKVKDSKKFLIDLIGTLKSFSTNDLVRYFRGIYLNRIKDDISKYLVHEKISILEINAYITQISENLQEKIEPEFARFGIELVNFNINDISVPEDDSAVIKLKDALAKRAEMDIIGYNYTQERSFDTLEGAAQNEGSVSSSLMGAGLGLGMGFGVGGSFKGAMENTSGVLDTSKTVKCKSCGNEVDANHKFCPFCSHALGEMVDREKSKCIQCGTENAKGVKFCKECGYKLQLSCSKCGEAVLENQKFCSNCGNTLQKQCMNCKAHIKNGEKFCSNCGTKVGEHSE